MLRWMIAAAALAASCAASPALAVTSISLPGSFNSEIGCSGDWQPDCAQAQMSLGGDGLWRASYTLPVGSYEYKIAYDMAWDENYGAGGVPNGPNIALDVFDAGASVSFVYDPASHIAAVLFGQPMAVSLPGSFNSEIGCPGDWDPACALAQMALAGDGLWYASYTLPLGSYEYKIAYNGSWDVNFGAGGVANGPNMAVAVGEPSALVYFRYDPATHLTATQFTPFEAVAGAVPEPASWAMMLLGFGAAGFALRRERARRPRLVRA